MTELDYEGFWKETLIQLRNTLGEEEFSGWFSDMKYLRAGENTIVVGIPSTFHLDKVRSRYGNNINTILKKVSNQEISIEYELTGKISKKETVQSQSQEENEEEKANPPVKTPKVKEKRGQHLQMRDDYTFDRYIIGDNNGFAANAAIAISKNPGKAYNPFLIFGGVGLGKTHLMQAIGNFIHENADNKVIYTTSENYLNEYVQAIQDNKMNLFKNKFRYTDVLLIDDIQFFQGKERIQEELYHTFNTLLDAKKQLVFTSDRPVTELKKLDERLKSRFNLCLKVDLQPPRYEERCAILKKTAESRNVSIPNEVIDLVSKNISSNVRDLISALETLIAYLQLTGKEITVEIAQQKLKNDFKILNEVLSIDNIIRGVSEYFNLTPNDLRGKKRTQNIVYARQLAMYISRETTDYSTTELGQDFGGRDHTTVMHSIEKIKTKLLTDPALESTIEGLKRSIKEFSAKH